SPGWTVPASGETGTARSPRVEAGPGLPMRSGATFRREGAGVQRSLLRPVRADLASVSPDQVPDLLLIAIPQDRVARRVGMAGVREESLAGGVVGLGLDPGGLDVGEGDAVLARQRPDDGILQVGRLVPADGLLEDLAAADARLLVLAAPDQVPDLVITLP